MQKTIPIGPGPLGLLANAVLHLANAIDTPCDFQGVGPSCEAARDLVRDLAAPDHAEQPRSTIAPSEVKANKADLLPTYDQWLAGLTVPSPLITMALVDGALKIYADGEPAPDHPYQQALDAQRYEADRVMVPAVEPGHPGPDDAWCRWALDPDATGHRAPFAPGDLVVHSCGREGIHRVLEVSVDVDAPRHRSLRLLVTHADVVVDRDAF